MLLTRHSQRSGSIRWKQRPCPTRMTSGKRRSLMELRSVKFSNGHIDQLPKSRTKVHSPPSKVKGSLMHPSPTARTQGENQFASAVSGTSTRSATTFLTRYDQLDGLRTAKSRK